MGFQLLKEKPTLRRWSSRYIPSITSQGSSSLIYLNRTLYLNWRCLFWGNTWTPSLIEGGGGFSKSWCVLLCNCRCVWQDCGCSWGQSMSACDVDEFVVNPASDLFFLKCFLIYMADFRFLKPLLFIAKWAKRVSFLGLLKKDCIALFDKRADA